MELTSLPKKSLYLHPQSLSARPGLTAIEWLEKQVDGLREDIKQVREDSLAREIRLMALLEHKIDTIQSETSSDKPVIRGVFSKLFK
ncbi:hypothetical protein [Bathymodiolus platifrons methanotrophic gill symbiont]|uniref:hypothetical protein n=1 Tax=Bathymodiolus platifrons methanotrophic gill symbiont TaxID=113268 RepID=UPI000B411F30|nr:hypothetical protein [Bathymodiolus platifrons methanotrophic gill symbiont]